MKNITIHSRGDDDLHFFVTANAGTPLAARVEVVLAGDLLHYITKLDGIDAIGQMFASRLKQALKNLSAFGALPHPEGTK